MRSVPRLLGCAIYAACTMCVGCAADASPVTDGVLQVETGPFTGRVSIEPDPPRVGEHLVVLTLDGEESVALEGASVTVSPWMPAHGHGAPDVDAVEDVPGEYVAEPVRLTMAGVWELRVHVAKGAREGELHATVEVP